MKKSLLIRSVIVGFASGVLLLGILTPQKINADSESIVLAKNFDKVSKTVKMIITAYSSIPEETDDTPFITASGKHVADGIIANNMLPFGTKVRIPQLYGEKVFTVEDRMNHKKGKYQADIWMPTHNQAKQFGAKITEVEILEN